MELRIIPQTKNNYPLCGILIKGDTAFLWLKCIQDLDLNLADVQVFPIPGLIANTIWGCLVILKHSEKIPTGRHELCQQVSANLYIPERSEIFPILTNTEIEKLFASGKHIIHPEFGILELPEETYFTELINSPAVQDIVITKPAPSVYIPTQVRSFQVQAVSPEQVLDNLTTKVFPKREKIKEKPLSILEKIRLGFYRTLFSKTSETAGRVADSKFLSRFLSKEKAKDIAQDFEDLEERNKKQLDKLLDMLRKDPDEALKYAIPLDDEGVTRGGRNSERFNLSRRWFDFSLFSQSTRNTSSSGGINLGDNFYHLQRQYIETAETLMKRKEFEKAAFVYMKLLKQYPNAANAMAMANRYQEAATIYLKHVGNKMKAAECYEKGNMILDAISIYKGINQLEKVGDLYLRIGNRGAAMEHYGEVVKQLKSKNNYVNASTLYRDKMEDMEAAQILLLDGWKQNIEAVSCLNTYFSNISDDENLRLAIKNIYEHNVTENNRESFLKVMHREYQRKKDLQETLREMAFEIVAQHLSINPAIVLELKNFNPGNKELSKDALRFKIKHKHS